VSEKINRKFLLNLNKYQKHIIYPILVFCFIEAIMVYLCLQVLVVKNFTYGSFKLLGFDSIFASIQFQTAIQFFLLVILIMLVFIILWIYHQTNKIIGPHDRIIRELDEIILGKRKDALTVRKDDDMFGELVDRINTIIGKS
jgi:cbb3-type cytochrome oxidase subunit 3